MTVCRTIQLINDQIRQDLVYTWLKRQRSFEGNCAITIKIINRFQWRLVQYNRLVKTHVSTINIFVIILQLNEASSYYILPTSLPCKNKMYLEYGDCCQQTIISCGNDLARVSNESPRTDSLTPDSKMLYHYSAREGVLNHISLVS